MGFAGDVAGWRYLSSRLVAKDVFALDDHRTDTTGVPEVDIRTVIGVSVQ